MARVLWGAMWRSCNELDGIRTHLLNDGNCPPILFRTRSAAREYINQVYGYIRTRPDLKAEPHGWMMPKAVRVEISIAEVNNGTHLRPTTP